MNDLWRWVDAAPGWLSLLALSSVLWVLVVVLMGARSWSRRRPAGPTDGRPVLDLGGIALAQLLDKLVPAIETMGSGAQDDQATTDLVLTTRSAYVAYMDSVRWRGAANGAVRVDPVTSQTLNDAVLDALKLVKVGSPNWVELKHVFDGLCDFWAAHPPE